MKTSEQHFEEIAPVYDSYKRRNWYYYDSVKKLLKNIIPENRSVLELGCGTGDLIACISPKKGLGIDVSRKMIEIARKKHKNRNLRFKTADVQTLKLNENFDYIFMVDVIEHLSNIKKSLFNISSMMNKKTMFINLMANPKWELIFLAAEKLHLKMPEGPHKRITYSEIEQILNESGLEVVDHGYSTLMPVYIPGITNIVNTYFEPRMKGYSCIEYFSARRRKN